VTAVLAGLEIRADQSGRAASGLLLATDVADYMVAKGMPFRDAHEIVGALVRKLVTEQRSFDSLTPEEWRAHSPLFEPDVTAWVTASSSVRRKRTPQSTNPDMVAAALRDVRGWLESLP
jgi:argininosuccinate lyase